ncbi:unnamed protein product [Dracunculus medinensis]|uniref:GLOBIN domain-containing protein n=1 Tax=Dracunculus medinensis TaxID=318479 RepID=A0A0N4UQA9_DRAME|nr:unnamed protein product [Dracunculus medinensis]
MLYVTLLHSVSMCFQKFIGYKGKEDKLLGNLCPKTQMKSAAQEQVLSIRSIRQYLDEDSRASTEQFLNFLGGDGLFILQQISTNIGDLPTSYLTRSMKAVAEEWNIITRGANESHLLLEKGTKSV